jgi:hypothetical protein
MIRASLAAAQSEISWKCPDKQASGNVDPGSMNLHAQIGLNVRFGSKADTRNSEKCRIAEFGV